MNNKVKLLAVVLLAALSFAVLTDVGEVAEESDAVPNVYPDVAQDVAPTRMYPDETSDIDTSPKWVYFKIVSGVMTVYYSTDGGVTESHLSNQVQVTAPNEKEVANYSEYAWYPYINGKHLYEVRFSDDIRQAPSNGFRMAEVDKLTVYSGGETKKQFVIHDRAFFYSNLKEIDNQTDKPILLAPGTGENGYHLSECSLKTLDMTKVLYNEKKKGSGIALSAYMDNLFVGTNTKSIGTSTNSEVYYPAGAKAKAIIVDESNSVYGLDSDGNLIKKSDGTILISLDDEGLPDAAEEMVIEDAIISQGYYADETVIKKLTIRNSTIWTYAFRACTNLEELVIEGCDYVGLRAFSGCTGLKTVTIKNSDVEGSYVFENCGTIDTVQILSDELNQNTIGAYSFSGTNIVNLTVRNTASGDYAFAESSITSADLSSCGNIGKYAFDRALSQEEISLGLYEDGGGIEIGARWTGAMDVLDGPKRIVYGDNVTFLGAESACSYATEELYLGKNITDSSFSREKYTLIGGNFLKEIEVSSDNPFLFMEGNILYGRLNTDELAAITYLRGLDEAQVSINPQTTEIWNCCFRGSELVEIIIPDNVEYLASRVFVDCNNLETVVIGAGIGTIEAYTFWNCESLKSIEYRGPVAKIGTYSFQNLSQLREVNLNTTTNVSIEQRAFEGCTSLETLTLRTDSPTGGIVTLKERALYGLSNLREVDVGDRTIKVQLGSFRYCSSLESIICSGIDIKSRYAFADCSSLKTIDISQSALVGECTFYNCTSLKTIVMPSEATLGVNAFQYCTSLTSIDLMGVSAIPNYAFQGCSSLTSVESNGFDTLGTYAFSGCSSLRTIFLGNPTTIGDRCFEDCTSMESFSLSDGSTNYSVVSGVLFTADMTTIVAYPAARSDSTYDIPASVTTLKAASFSGARNLVNIHIPAGVITIGDNTSSSRVFAGCSSNRAFTVDSGNATFQVINGTDLALKDSTTPLYTALGAISGTLTITEAVPAGLYYGSSTITGVILGEGVEIGDNAFSNCKNLTEVVLVPGTKVGNSSFKGCTSLGSLTIPNDVTLSADSFANCTGLAKLEIPMNTAATVGAFTGCTGIETVTLTSFDSTADYTITYRNTPWYQSRETMTDISVPSEMDFVPNYMFYGCSALGSFDISSMDYVGKYAFTGCTSLTSVVSDHTDILDGAYQNCTGLTNLSLGSKASSLGAGLSVGTNAFANCIGLKKIAISDDVTIGSEAFGEMKFYTFMGSKQTVDHSELPGAVWIPSKAGIFYDRNMNAAIMDDVPVIPIEQEQKTPVQTDTSDDDEEVTVLACAAAAVAACLAGILLITSRRS